jgi:hypothetical protein
LGKKLVHKSIAFLLVFTLAYVQTVLAGHQSHRTTQHSHHSSNQDQVNTYTVKCVICDYASTRRSEVALLSSPVQITVFEKTIHVFKDKSKTDILYCFQQEHFNKGPPTA